MNIVPLMAGFDQAAAIGLALIAQAANLLVFSAVGLRGLTTPIIKKGATALEEGHPDPLAQALVLTAIVISFGVLAFCLTLLKKAYEEELAVFQKDPERAKKLLGVGESKRDAAIDEGVPTPVISSALFSRFSSRGDAEFADKLLSAMRFEFGGHLEKKAP